jgi:glutamate dehydrogenase/leucine dehydrogenase
MALKRTKLLGIQAITGINTVGILTVGTTQTAGGVGIASTTYLRGVVMHNTGLATATSSLYVYPSSVAVSGVGQTAYRLARVDLACKRNFLL